MKNFRIIVVIRCVGGRTPSVDQHISSKRTKWQLAKDEKSIPALKN
jgi:hypothetical protein